MIHTHVCCVKKVSCTSIVPNTFYCSRKFQRKSRFPLSMASPSVSDTQNRKLSIAIAKKASISQNQQDLIVEDFDRQCWICFANLKDDLEQGQIYDKNRWVRPCRCRGTAKWVHQQCLQRWVDEKQKGDLMVDVACDRCRCRYRILYPPPDYLIWLLERCEHVGNKACPLAAALMLSGCAYWCLVTCGAVTLFVACGHQQGQMYLEKADPVFLLLTLPVIPFALLFIDSLPKYTDEAVAFLARLTLTNGQEEGGATLQQRLAIQRQHKRAASVVLVESMALPLVSRLLGDWLFRQKTNNVFWRTVLGAATFLTVRCACRIYLNYRQLGRQTKRQILDYSTTGNGDRQGHSRQSSATINQ